MAPSEYYGVITPTTVIETEKTKAFHKKGNSTYAYQWRNNFSVCLQQEKAISEIGHHLKTKKTYASTTGKKKIQSKIDDERRYA